MYETKRSTWVVGTVAGAVLALGLMIAGDSYVRVAQTVAPYGVDVVQFGPVTITGQKRAASVHTDKTAGAAATGAAVGNL